MSRIVLAIIGSRKFPNLDLVDRWLAEHWDERFHIISGGASGVDRQAAALAAIHGDSPEEIRPDYAKFPASEYGKDFAPKWRNREIARRCDRMVAFWDGRSTGTANAIAWAVFYRRPLQIVLDEPT